MAPSIEKLTEGEERTVTDTFPVTFPKLEAHQTLQGDELLLGM